MSQDLIDDDPGNLGYRLDTILTKVMFAKLKFGQGDATSAKVELESARKLFPDFGPEGSSNLQSQFLLGLVNQCLAEIAFYNGDWEDALELFSLALNYARPIRREGNHQDDYLIAVYSSGILDSLIRLQDFDLVQTKLALYVEEFPSIDMFALAARIHLEMSEIRQAGELIAISEADLIKRATEVADRAVEFISQQNNPLALHEAFFNLCIRPTPASVAERVYQRAKEKFGDGDGGPVPWEVIIASLRANAFKECLTYLETHLIARDEVGIHELSKVLVKSIAHQHLGEDAEARKWLRKAEDIVSRSDYVSRHSQQWLSQTRALVKR